MHPELVPKKTEFSKRVNKLQAAFSRAVNRFLLPLRYSYAFHEGKWQFRRLRMKPKKLRHTFEDGTPNWNLDGAAPLPLDENAQRRLVELTGPVSHDASVTKRPKGKARRYLKRAMSIEALFAALNEAGVKYVVLHATGGSPSAGNREGIDLLFADEAMGVAEQYFTATKSTDAIRVNVYSSGGMPGSTFEGLPYYETRLAEELLDNAVAARGEYRVPDQRRHLLTLAYHAVYHLAHDSGLPLNVGEPPLMPNEDRDYATEIAGIAKEQGLEAELSLRGLHEFLMKQGWMPAVDTLRKLSLNRPVITLFLANENLAYLPGKLSPKLSVFVVREWADNRNLTPWISANLRHYGFDVKWVHVLSEVEKERARTGVRGGNWNQGPYAVSGGPPTSVIVACDYAPEPPDDDLLREQPFADNARLMLMKKLLRNGVNQYLPEHLTVNPVHSADDDHEAWDYLTAICPDKIDDIRSRVDAGYTGDPGLRLRLSRGKRATTYLVYRDGKPCVLKVFADHPDGRTAYLAEKRASETFAEKPWASGWIEFGPTWMVQDFHNPATRLDLIVDKLSEAERKTIAGKTIRIAREIHNAGYAHRDLHAENFFFEDGELKLIDFETLVEQSRETAFEASYDITGQGLDSPGVSGRMCYTNTKNERSLTRVLGIPLAEALDAEKSLGSITGGKA